ncbi:uncharacterized protein K460DRAFT_350695 [Cucurbitaria berberidis CBS 394.84]|uniref:Uncharacterized protein n=1 Tax=Cucurbitaria berberidis CBS 394.84 TaxID=1168544 RepID=A0A9P4GRV2_9PLEO|nr:uncharacterized protein K460DRAFT_350695 [Cucurbitaria berberidis CBS 394.84]KAF1850667.1 hypothetical protein K460DRAFT_350695 [Cucurbitaria berberidis CBS 394.84]
MLDFTPGSKASIRAKARHLARKKLTAKSVAPGLIASKTKKANDKTNWLPPTVSSSTSALPNGYSRKRLSRDFDVHEEINERPTKYAKRPCFANGTCDTPVNQVKGISNDSDLKATKRSNVPVILSPYSDDEVQFIGSRRIHSSTSKVDPRRFDDGLELDGSQSTRPSGPNLRSEQSQTSNPSRRPRYLDTTGKATINTSSSISNAPTEDTIQNFCDFESRVDPVFELQESYSQKRGLRPNAYLRRPLDPSPAAPVQNQRKRKANHQDDLGGHYHKHQKKTSQYALPSFSYPEDPVGSIVNVFLDTLDHYPSHPVTDSTPATILEAMPEGDTHDLHHHWTAFDGGLAREGGDGRTSPLDLNELTEDYLTQIEAQTLNDLAASQTVKVSTIDATIMIMWGEDLGSNGNNNDANACVAGGNMQSGDQVQAS